MSPRYSYCPDPHPVFTVPPTSTPIWRYMTLSKLLMLLDSRKLFFCRASKFEDRFEGAIPRPLDERMRAWEAQHMGEDARKKAGDERIRTREIVVINCWHMSRHESSAMWSLYGKSDECVAIRSTVDRLISCLPQQRQGDEEPGWKRIMVSKVDYIDYSTATFPPHNVYYPFVHKREDYGHENELRALTMISQAAQEAASKGEPAEFEITDFGLALPVNVETLIEKVYVSPTASKSFETMLRSTLEHFDFGSLQVVRSAMAEDPIY